MRAEDATALAMILSELVQNAVEHGLADRDGKVEVAVTRQTLDDGEEQLTVVITDDGVGLPAGFRPSLAGLGHPDRDVAGGRPQGPDPVGEQRAERHPGRVRRAAAAAALGTEAVGEVLAGQPARGLEVMAAGAPGQPARRARALRRLSARRSSSDMPPQTPAS